MHDDNMSAEVELCDERNCNARAALILHFGELPLAFCAHHARQHQLVAVEA